MKDYKIYRYYKGEPENPFDKEKQNTAHNFWGYESLFEEKFNKGDYSLAAWQIPSSLKGDWEFALKPPVDKEEMFKVWLYELFERLADKAGGGANEFSWFNRMYWDTDNSPLPQSDNNIYGLITDK